MKNKNEINPWIFMLFGTVLVILVQIAFYWLIRCGITGWWHNVGDSFAVLNTTFTGVALFGLSIAYISTQKQIEQAKRQNWESYLSTILNSWSSLVQNLPTLTVTTTKEQNKAPAIFIRPRTQYFIKDIEGEKVTVESSEEKSGKHYFEFAYSKLNERYLYEAASQKKETENIEAAWTKYFNDNEHILGVYFRLLFNIFEYIDESTYDDKEKYAKIVRAHLSKYELIMLFYNSIQPSNSDFKPLIFRFDILASFQRSWLFSELHLEWLRPLMKREPT